MKKINYFSALFLMLILTIAVPVIVIAEAERILSLCETMSRRLAEGCSHAAIR